MVRECFQTENEHHFGFIDETFTNMSQLLKIGKATLALLQFDLFDDVFKIADSRNWVGQRLS